MYKITIILFLIFNGFMSAFSQQFRVDKTVCDTCQEELFLRFESSSFFKNNEYANDFTSGFTGIGSFMKPTLEYYFADHTKVNVGVFLLKYSGLDSYSQSIPIFTVQHRLSQHIDIVLGNIYGTLQHRLQEPMYRFDRYYQNNVEYGLQFLFHTSFVKSDLWVNWEKFIVQDDPFQEQFVVGSVSQFNVWSREAFRLKVPLQLLVSHIGGEIDTSPNPAVSMFNTMSGIELIYDFGQDRLLSFEPMFFYYSGKGLPDSGPNSQKYQNGKAIYLQINYQTQRFNASLGYWNANKFLAPQGEYLFASVSDRNIDFFQNNRQLITAKFGWDYSISDALKLIFRTDTYYDLDNENLAFSNGIYFLVNESFFIKKIETKSTIPLNSSL